MRLLSRSNYERSEEERDEEQYEFSQLPYRERQARLKAQNVPRYFYKYLSLRSSDPDKPKQKWEHACDYLIKSQFYLSSGLQFNDPFDMKGSLITDIPREKIRYFLEKRFKKIYPHLTPKELVYAVNSRLADPKELLGFLENNLKIAAEKFGVTCLSTEPCNILMWSHYADHHKGITLQFEHARDTYQFRFLQEVQYSNRFPMFNCFDDREDYSILVLRKHCGWAYEKEWRLIKANGQKTYHSFNSRALTGIILGCRIDLQHEKWIREIAEDRERMNLGSVAIYKARQHKTRYQLVLSRA